VLIRGAARTDRGKVRPKNEDAFGFFPDTSFYVVADGMGGYLGGQVASALAVEALRLSVQETQDEALTPVTDPHGWRAIGWRRLCIAVQLANSQVFETSQREPELRGMGTTIAAILFDDEDRLATICHVGDSRVYRVRDHGIELLTEDHSLMQQLLREGYAYPQRQLKQFREVLLPRIYETRIERECSFRSLLPLLTPDHLTTDACRDSTDSRVWRAVLLNRLLRSLNLTAASRGRTNRLKGSDLPRYWVWANDRGVSRKAEGGVGHQISNDIHVEESYCPIGVDISPLVQGATFVKRGLGRHYGKNITLINPPISVHIAQTTVVKSWVGKDGSCSVSRIQKDVDIFYWWAACSHLDTGKGKGVVCAIPSFIPTRQTTATTAVWQPVIELSGLWIREEGSGDIVIGPNTKARVEYGANRRGESSDDGLERLNDVLSGR
jgi:hypothetical protein